MSNETYKLTVDVHRRNQNFNEHDYVMVRVRFEHYPKYSFKKLHARASGPFRIICKLGPNAYLLDLSSDITINLVFNVEDLFPYRDTFEPPKVSVGIPIGRDRTFSMPIPKLPQIHQSIREQIEGVTKDEIVGSTYGGF